MAYKSVYCKRRTNSPTVLSLLQSQPVVQIRRYDTFHDIYEEQARNMGWKRKPPPGNVRRISSIGGNLRYAIANKANETVQCESFQERKLTLLFDRDPTVQEYRSQPERFTFTDSEGTSHTYVPDFMVWRTNGAVEIHEVTLTSRQDRLSIQEREKAARKICQQRGWRYIVHTEQSLPQPTEEANLLALYRYHPTSYAHPDVTWVMQEQLRHSEQLTFQQLSVMIMQHLDLPHPTVVSALCHLLWHGLLVTDLDRQLIFHNAAPRADLTVWLSPGGQSR